MTPTIEVVRQNSRELRDGLNRLLPQLSENAEALSEEDVEALISSSAVTLFVALSDDRIVGALTLVIFPIPTGIRAWIEDVVVDEGARGLGVGEALTAAAIDEARRRNVRSIDLTSRPSRESANALYKKLGFELRSTNVYRYVIE